MGQAIATAIFKKAEVVVFDHDSGLKKIAQKRGLQWLGNFSFINGADVVLVAVKPKDIAELSEKISGFLNKKTILISIAAGTSIKHLSSVFSHSKIVRVMPNLSLTVGQGIAAWKSAGLPFADKKSVKRFLDLWTENFEVSEEEIIDKVTAISGSGPAYFFLLAWSLQQAAINLGFNQKQSRLLVEKTFSGAALLQSGQEYEALIKKVMSKKGTTEAAFGVLKKYHFDKIVKEAATAAYKRAKEISKGKK